MQRQLGPRIYRGALVSIDSSDPRPTIIAFQYNPATLRRTIQPKVVGGEPQDRTLAVRFVGAPIETITIDIELDAIDQLEKNDPTAVENGIYPQLAALELLAYPASNDIIIRQQLLARGTIEVAPLTAPRLIFVWGKHKALPVSLTGYTVTEDEFDGRLNPIRATVSLNMRVLNYSDLDSSNRDYHQFLAYQQFLEAEAKLYKKLQIGYDIKTEVS